MRICQSLSFSVIFIFFVAVFSCRKSNKDIVAMDMDTLTQNIYTIDSMGTPTPGVILTAPYIAGSSVTSPSPGLLQVMDEHGKVLQEQATDLTAFGFVRWKIEGQTRYSYVVNDNNAYRPFGVPNLNTGYAVITDSTLREIKRVGFIASGPGPYPTGQALDVHDFILLSDDHYITMSYYQKYVTNIPAYLNPSPRAQVLAPLVQEIENGVVIWQWDASLDTSFHANTVEGNSYGDSTIAQDYMHMNAMFVDPRDNNLVCSFRNQDQIIKVNRQTGGIMWRLGGKNSDFQLFSDQVFLRQHNPSLTDNNQTLLIFDNGDSVLRPESRVVEFKLDEVGKAVKSFKSFTIPEPFTQYTGSVQKMGDEYFIGGGTANYMLEVNYVTGQKVMEFKGSQPSYRSFKLPPEIAAP